MTLWHYDTADFLTNQLLFENRYLSWSCTISFVGHLWWPHFKKYMNQNSVLYKAVLWENRWKRSGGNRAGRLIGTGVCLCASVQKDRNDTAANQSTQRVVEENGSKMARQGRVAGFALSGSRNEADWQEGGRGDGDGRVRYEGRWSDSRGFSWL